MLHQVRPRNDASFVEIRQCDDIHIPRSVGGRPAETSLGPIADGFGNGTGQIWA
jgi:hypothetical protein